ncbi:FAD-binding oxidoreductase [Kribbella sandramycini]|uniref:Alkyldihydroxyacetonephosphate synthase n=1 Tax=Kribbella sandramycini TaxID=60450 RepID=A0A7Y4KZ53_9ACTN|nr:FAD-binding oxidoreductase [Kribbella sandramycini]MBB6569854.1 alkyldihydroxyacetonephosphate synthase [Kribbella sandramycini]NOL40321.1 FAD-binding oxidoreductase [Kribbella sandramycini]
MTVQHMKWWGWGVEGVAFSHDDKPSLAPFVQKVVDVDLNADPRPPMDFAELDVPESRLDEKLQRALTDVLGAEYVVATPLDRVVHAFGKSLRDLLRVRASDLRRIPDVVVYPADEEQIAAVLDAVVAADAVLIPFGGGSNISGSLEAPAGEERQVVSLDLGRLNKVLSIDEESGLARIQAGALGPDLEQQLGEKGWTLGHFPDSFTHSSLGGWIATRSSGMQSDKYGDIADITRALRVVQPGGTLATRAVPVTSTGPSVREMILGSEGRLGIITEATVQVHRKPAERVVLGYFFPDFRRGVAAMRAIAASDAAPSITRISDARETSFSFATRKTSKGVAKLMSSALIAVLRKRGWDLEQMCLSFIGYEGSPEHVTRQRKLVKKIVSDHGGICVGAGPGELYDQKKFDTPYIRDFLLDRGALADVSETSTSWSKLLPLYDKVVERANEAFAQLGVKGWIMCHLSHSYHSGACLYFTFAFKQAEGDPIAQYDVVKSAVQQAFIDADGTLSHHHAVGTEHARWLADDISAPGVQLIQGLVATVDPGRNLNPGKIVS